jgi:hypothetical protein
MDAIALINAALAAPKTHRVLTLYESGDIHTHDCRNMASAQTYAVGERRKLGRDLIRRETGETVRVVSVEILGL